MELVIPSLRRFDPPVTHISIWIDFLNYDPLVEKGGPHSHIEEGVGLFPRDDLVEPVTIGHLFVVIVFLADLDDEIIGLLVPKAREIELVGAGLARMPDLVEVRRDFQRPTKD